MSGFMKYLTKINSSLLEEEEDEEVLVEEQKVVEEQVVKPKQKPQPVKKAIPQKVDASVSIVEDRIRSKLDDIGLNSKLINEVVSFVLNDVSNVPNLKSSKGANFRTVAENARPQPVSVNEFKTRNDIRGAAEFLLEGVPEMSQPGSVRSSYDGGEPVNSRMSSVADKASSLL